MRGKRRTTKLSDSAERKETMGYNKEVLQIGRCESEPAKPSSLKRVVSCARCRAYESRATGVMGGSTIERYCSLGYSQTNGRPDERCPKPLTIGQLIAANDQAQTPPI